jgi:hypothetical protein
MIVVEVVVDILHDHKQVLLEVVVHEKVTSMGCKFSFIK